MFVHLLNSIGCDGVFVDVDGIQVRSVVEERSLLSNTMLIWSIFLLLLRWFLLCVLSGPILFVPLDEFRWMELICLEMMEFHVGPCWGNIAVLLNPFLLL